MIKLGVCTSISNIKKAAAAGFDYLEAALNGIAAMSDEDFEKALGEVNQSPIKVEACNCLLPGTLKVTGPEVNAQALHDYLEKAFTRAQRLGVKVVVFGSGAARRVPEGFDVPQAWRQIANFLRLLKLPAEVQLGLHDHTLDMGHARALLSLDDPKLQLKLYNETIKKGLSVRQVEQRAKQMQQAADMERGGNDSTSNAKDYQILQKHLASTFGVPVRFTFDKTGKGKITFPFSNDEQLERIISIFDTLKNT